jgi:hypothetical protein
VDRLDQFFEITARKSTVAAEVACTLHVDDLSSTAALLACEVRWCPSCGTCLSTD